MLPLNIRTNLMGDISNRPMYVLAVLNTSRWGGRDGGRLPTVFNLAATFLAFRADDKEMSDPCVLSHSLNVEFRRYPSTPVQQFTCFLFFSVLHARAAFLSLLVYIILQLLSMRLCPAATWFVFPSLSLSLFFSPCNEATEERYSILFGLYLIPMNFALLFDVKHMCLKAQGRSCLWLFSSSACFLNTICRFLAVLSSLGRQISQVCSCFASRAFNTLLLLTFFCFHYYFSLEQYS